MTRPLVILVAAVAIPTLALAQADSAKAPDLIPQLVARLDLERYKATIKGLTAFGDRRQGTDRNRAAVDWIEAQLRSYGCSDVSRLKYDFQPSPPSPEGRGGQGVRTRDTIRASGGYRGTQIGAGWDPNWHQPTDLYATYDERGLSARAERRADTLAALAGLTGATLK